MADKLSSGVFISEILADNAGGPAIDTDGDGNITKADEFIEIQSTSGTPVSLDGYQLWSQQDGLLFSFGAGTSVDPGGTATVVGEYTGTPPPGFFSAGNPNNSNFLQDGEGNKWDSIFLVDTNTGEYVVLSYGNPVRPVVEPSGFPGTIQIGDGESISSGAPNGRAFARDENGDFIETTPDPGAPDVACFLPGTLIDTASGLRAIETLACGDLIVSRDHGPVPLCEIHRHEIGAARLLAEPRLRPVALPPADDHEALSLSPAHRILLCEPRADILFGSAEVLVPARALVRPGLAAVRPVTGPISYLHLAFERHELIKANGVWVESFYSADAAEFPQTHIRSELRHKAPARRLLKGFEAELVLRERQGTRAIA